MGSGMAALAGCAGFGGGTGAGSNGGAGTGSNGTDDRYPLVERSIGESYDTRSGPSVTVRNPRLRKSVVVDQHTSPVQMAPDRQFVVVDVATEASTDSGRREAGSLGSRFRVLTDGTPARGRSAPLRPAFHPSETGRPVGVPVPIATADEAAVAWVRGLPKSVAWSLPDGVVTSLDTAPSFRVESVDVSDETDPQVTLTVTNTGDRDGTFYANVSGSRVQDGNAVVGFAVPASETVTHRDRPGITAPSGEETRVVVRWGVDQAALVIHPE